MHPIDKVLLHNRLNEWKFSGCQYKVFQVEYTTVTVFYTVCPRSKLALEVQAEFRVPSDFVPSFDSLFRKWKHKIWLHGDKSVAKTAKHKTKKGGRKARR